jgi:hypothetical protein
MLHQELANGNWLKLSFLEQVGNIGSEVERTIRWKEKGNNAIRDKAFLRSLELFDLTLNSNHTYSQLKEIARTREIWVDYIYFENQYNSNNQQFRKYFNELLLTLRLLPARTRD